MRTLIPIVNLNVFMELFWRHTLVNWVFEFRNLKLFYFFSSNLKIADPIHCCVPSNSPVLNFSTRIDRSTNVWDIKIMNYGFKLVWRWRSPQPPTDSKYTDVLGQRRPGEGKHLQYLKPKPRSEKGLPLIHEFKLMVPDFHYFLFWIPPIWWRMEQSPTPTQTMIFCVQQWC